MGRHSISYLESQQDISKCRPAAHVGRVGLLAVVLGIGAAVVSGTGLANADVDHSKSADNTAQSTSDTTNSPSTGNLGKRHTLTKSPSANNGAESGPKKSPVTKTAALRPSADNSATTNGAVTKTAAVAPAHREPAAAATVTTAPPAPRGTDQVSTEFGNIGKWMLKPFGSIANYGGQKYQGKTLLEPVNVIIVDPGSATSTAAKKRLSTAMTAGGFPAQTIHSGGFKGIIDGRAYRQQPTGFLEAFSNNAYTQTNDHGRIFGPDPVQTSSGYVWTGAFSTEKVSGYFFGIPVHSYVSSNAARSALAASLIASGQATYGGTVKLDNAYNTGKTSTGDHDGYAVVLILNQLAGQARPAGSRSSV